MTRKAVIFDRAGNQFIGDAISEILLSRILETRF